MECERDGERGTWQEPITDEEIRRIERDNASYLAGYGVPVPPSGVRFEVRLPAGVTGLDLERAVITATMGFPPVGERIVERRAIEGVLRDLLRD